MNPESFLSNFWGSYQIQPGPLCTFSTLQSMPASRFPEPFPLFRKSRRRMHLMNPSELEEAGKPEEPEEPEELEALEESLTRVLFKPYSNGQNND